MSIFKKDISKLSDEALMSRLQKQNDMSALTLLYERYASRILGFLLKIFKGDEPKAQDYLQDIFIKVQEKRDHFDCSKKFYTWIFTIANNHAKSSFRLPTTEDIADSKEPTTEWNSQYEIEASELKSFLKDAVQELDINHRTVLTLLFYKGFSIKEISEIIEVNEGTVKSRIFYATKKLSYQYHLVFNQKELNDERK
jgi:RNA polymerase sigma-70 factor (ECF subfamily)